VNFVPSELVGAWLVEPERHADERGFFARTWCVREFEAQGLNTDLVQCNISFNEHAATLRGMHWQSEPFAEIKLVRCTTGAIFDVIADVRPDSKTFGQWQSFELSATNRKMLYIPAGFAHGFFTTQPHTEVAYQMSDFFHPEASCGIRWDDPELGIHWPSAPAVVSDRDQAFPGFADVFGKSVSI